MTGTEESLASFMKADNGGWAEAYFGYEEVRKELVELVDRLIAAGRVAAQSNELRALIEDAYKWADAFESETASMARLDHQLYCSITNHKKAQK